MPSFLLPKFWSILIISFLYYALSSRFSKILCRTASSRNGDVTGWTPAWRTCHVSYRRSINAKGVVASKRQRSLRWPSAIWSIYRANASKRTTIIDWAIWTVWKRRHDSSTRVKCKSSVISCSLVSKSTVTRSWKVQELFIHN